ncbi:unnamed protein product [Polarella glacialis]|uniref:Nudix hydrolase domain-containing protein n=1 Tax=Polarella glacialis TaxID=89957 RepID=A0A813HHY7_POLGL|nr:unnamed protein product [Polarella glacialis]
MEKPRRDKDESDPRVRLFVASSGWPYKPSYTPSRPLLVLSGASAEDQEFPGLLGVSGVHPCRRYAELVCAVVEPQHDCLFIIDVSEVASPSDWRSELARPGRSARMLERWFAKFNPRESTVLAFGEDVSLWAPLLRLNDEQRVSRMIVVGRAPPEGVAGLLAKAEVETTVLEQNSSMGALSEAVARGGGQGDLSLEDLYFVSVEFDIHRKSKQLVQDAANITSQVARLFVAPRVVAPASGGGFEATAAAAAAPVPVPAEVLALLEASPSNSAAAVQGVASHHLVAGMSFSGLVVQVFSCTADGDALRAELADAHGCVDGLFPKSLQSVATRGRFLSLSGQVVTVEGRLLVVASSGEPHRGLRDGYQPAQQGARNVSEWPRRFGCLVLRGRKCVLARSNEQKLYIPADEAHTHETAEQAATRALAEACDIFPEEIALLQNVAPVIVYESDGSGSAPVAVLTVFAALAVNPPPAGSQEDQDTVEDEEDLYDWFPYEQAMSLLLTQHERVAVTSLAAGVAAAVSACVVLPDFPYSFGPRQQACEAASLLLSPPPLPADVPPPPVPEAPAGYPSSTLRREKNCRRGNKLLGAAKCPPGCC